MTADAVREESIKGVFVKLTKANLHDFTGIDEHGNHIDSARAEDYRRAGRALLTYVSQRPNLIALHESLTPSRSIGASADLESIDDVSEGIAEPDWVEQFLFEEGMLSRSAAKRVNRQSMYDHWFGSPPSDEFVRAASRYLGQFQLDVVPYSTNAEMSILASNFIERTEKRLVFRIYLPEGRLWADEAEKLIDLFHDWMTKVQRRSVRKGGYRTAAGQVVEFYAEDRAHNLSDQVEAFDSFLRTCLDDAPGAEMLLIDRYGLTDASASALVRRFSIEADRLMVDAKYSLEIKQSQLRHRCHSELLLLAQQGIVRREDIPEMAELLIPDRSLEIRELSAALPPPSFPGGAPISQAVRNYMDGVAQRELNGWVNYPLEIQQLLALAAKYGGSDKQVMLAVYELADEGAGAAIKVEAKSRVLAFLGKLTEKISDVAIETIAAYVKAHYGIP